MLAMMAVTAMETSPLPMPEVKPLPKTLPPRDPELDARRIAAAQAKRERRALRNKLNAPR